MNIEQIKEKFKRLMSLNPNGEFGYINEPLSENEILEFEDKHNIKLPNDYRTFIGNMFDGGVGPEQIMPLEFWDSIHNATYLGSLGNKLSEPFLLTEKWEDDYNDENEYNAVINGTIRLCHIGCGNFLFLVVNGKEYGNIWIDDRASNSEIIPIIPRINFEKWYNQWLDTEIKEYEKQNTVSNQDKTE